MFQLGSKESLTAQIGGAHWKSPLPALSQMCEQKYLSDLPPPPKNSHHEEYYIFEIQNKTWICHCSWVDRPDISDVMKWIWQESIGSDIPKKILSKDQIPKKHAPRKG